MVMCHLQLLPLLLLHTGITCAVQHVLILPFGHNTRPLDLNSDVCCGLRFKDKIQADQNLTL